MPSVIIKTNFCLQSGPFAYLDEPRDVRLETHVLQWIPAYEKLGFCLQFQLLLPGKSGSSNLTVLLKFYESQEIVLWQLSGYHGDQWSFSQVSWTPRRSAKVEKIRHISHIVSIIDDHRVIIDNNAKFLVGILLVKIGQISSCVTFLPAMLGHLRHLYSRQLPPRLLLYVSLENIYFLSNISKHSRSSSEGSGQSMAPSPSQ